MRRTLPALAGVALLTLLGCLDSSTPIAPTTSRLPATSPAPAPITAAEADKAINAAARALTAALERRADLDAGLADKNLAVAPQILAFHALLNTRAAGLLPQDLTIFHAGEPYGHTMLPAMLGQKSMEPKSTLAASHRAMLTRLLPKSQPDWRYLRNDDQRFVVSGLADTGFAKMRWNIAPLPPDPSSTAIGCLGLDSVEDNGGEITLSSWNKVLTYTSKAAAALDTADRASVPDAVALLLAYKRTLMSNPTVKPESRENTPEKLEQALAALPPAQELDLLTLYLLQQLARLDGRTRITDSDMIAAVLARQKPDGFFAPETLPSWGLAPVAVTTSYALLILADARTPVILQKLDYGPAATSRPQDAYNLNRRLGRWLCEGPTRWRLVSAAPPPSTHTDPMLDAPVLLITGSGNDDLAPAHLQRLARYIHAGGVVLSTADGGDPSFTRAVQRWANTIGDGQFEMRPLPHDHPLFQKDIFADIRTTTKYLGLSNGIREWWIHCPEDAGLAWQQSRYATPGAFELPSNLLLYATGRRVFAPQSPPPGPPAKTQSALTIARVRHPGNWNPEPAVWQNFAPYAAAAGIGITTVDLRPAALNPHTTAVAHLATTGDALLADAEINALKNYVARGGVLILDAAGGSAPAAKRVTAIADRVQPDGDVSWINVSLPRDQLRLHTRRAFRADAQSPPLPQIAIFRDKDQLRIVRSQLDLSASLAGARHWGIDGYTVETTRNYILKVLQEIAASRSGK